MPLILTPIYYADINADPRLDRRRHPRLDPRLQYPLQSFVGGGKNDQKKEAVNYAYR